MLNPVIFYIQMKKYYINLKLNKNKQNLKFYHKEIEGSTTLFKALLDKCIQREKFILCEIVARSNTSPRLAALIPQQEEFDEEVKTIQKHPPGFHVVYLPYADDFRQIERVIETKCNF